MPKPSFVYVTYIASTPEKVFTAITDPEITQRYWSGMRNVSDWRVGSAWQHQPAKDPTDVYIVGKVLESDPPRKLVLSWADPDDAADPEKVSRVTFEIGEYKGSVRLKGRHEELEPDSSMLKGISSGWPFVLASLKSILETSSGLPGSDQHPDGPPPA
jgi:uncharacterized protein YndB with AHSA1/START domain